MAIELAIPLIWFEDRPLQFRIEELEQCGLVDRWVKVDLVAEQDQFASLFDGGLFRRVEQKPEHVVLSAGTIQ